MFPSDWAAERRRRVLRRGAPVLGGLALVGLLAGVVAAGTGPSERERTAERFASAWASGQYAEMHALLTPAAAGATPIVPFARAYRAAAGTATLAQVRPGEPREAGEGVVAVPVRLVTRAFGEFDAELRLPVGEEGIAWTPALAFPGLGERERLERRTTAPPRSDLLARGGEVLARGPAGAREYPLGEVGRSVAGSLSPPEAAPEQEALHARGFPPATPAGASGLERIFDERLAGVPGGELRAGGRVLARSEPRPGRPVRTTIDAGLQRAAQTALGGRFGGIAALDARSGEVRALVGIAFSAPQPPGSTFKIITAAAALEAGAVELSSRFEVERSASIDGVELENANREACGGTFVESFAESCNSVFGPLGVKVGAERLVATAERFGFNGRPQFPGAARSTMPPAPEIGGGVELGATAIGQGKLLATPLLMAEIAQTVAAGGVHRGPTLIAGEGPPERRVIPAAVARALERLMIAVVEQGTGRAASLGELARVAGKTGTAELRSTQRETPPGEEDPAGDPSDTDAWFTAYAPTRRPRLAVAVMLVGQGAGGETAAPAAAQVLRAAFAPRGEQGDGGG